MNPKFKFRLIPIKVFFSLLVISNTLFADTKELFPNAMMKHETQWLMKVLEQAHYNKLGISDLNTTSFINRYITKLDKQKLYFTNNEISEFQNNYKSTLVTHFQQGNLLPGFEIFNKYKQKAIARLSWVLGQIEETPDIYLDKNHTVNREDADWCDSEKSLDDIWKKLISFEYIREIVQQTDSNKSKLTKDKNELSQYISESRENLTRSYSRWIKNIEELEASDVQEIYLTTLTHMFDPHTVFMNMKEKEKFDQAMNNEFVGIGARLQDEDGYCTIKSLLPGGPAEASRELEPEDIILKVAQSEGEFVDVVDMKLTKIVDLIKGPKDTSVRLEIRPIKNPTETKEIRIVRDKIKLTENLAKAYVKQIEINDEKVNFGVVELPSFYGSSGNGPKATDDVEELINELKNFNIKGLVLDLRRNGGGYLSEAVNLTGLFISRGPVVQVKNTDGKIRKKFDFNPKIAWNGPLITLVSRYSASASEIVAGALQDHNRAIIVGDKSTHGKGTVQSMIQMNLPFNLLGNRSLGKTSAAKITIQKYYLPSGKSTQINGVNSDISIPSINMFLPIGESDLDNALQNDSIAPVNFRKTIDQYSFSKEDLEFLSEKTKERRSDSPIFNYLDQNIKFFKSKRETKSFSLDVNKRITQRYEENIRNEAFKSQYDDFEDLSFPSKDIVLSVVSEQINESRRVRGFDDNASKDTSTFIKPVDLDIPLNESLKILKDHFQIKLEMKSVTKSLKNETPNI
jgi:carboxyl-terminal processing protease